MGGQVAAVAAVKPEVKIQIVMEYHLRYMLQVEGCNCSYVPVKSCCGAPVMMFAGGKDFSVFTSCPPIKKQLRLVCLPMRRLCAVAGFERSNCFLTSGLYGECPLRHEKGTSAIQFRAFAIKPVNECAASLSDNLINSTYEKGIN